MGEERCILDPHRDCIGAAKALLLEKRIEDLEAWKDDSKRFQSDFYAWQREQIARDAKLDEQIYTMGQNIDKIVQWQEDQQKKPEKRMDAILDKLIWGVMGAVVAYFMTKMGM